MTWFAAHIVMGIKPAEGTAGEIGVFENIVLLEAASAEEAGRLAVELGREEERVDDGLTVNGRPAVRVFAGVRKVVTVSNPHPYNLDGDRPVSTTEVSYLELVVDDDEALGRLGRGEPVTVRYVQ